MAEVRRTYYETGELESEVFVINGKLNGEQKKISSKWKIRKYMYFY